MRHLAVALSLLLLVAACGRTVEKPLSEPGEKLYTLTGKILSRDAGDNTLRIEHQAVPGFMEAMTMDFSVRGAKVDAMPPNGSRIEAKLHVTGTGYWVTEVKRLP